LLTMRGVLVACLLVAVLGVGIHSYPARKLDLAEELLNEAEAEGDDVEVTPQDIKKDEVAGSGAAARKDTVAVEKKEDPESDESDSPASGDEDTSGDDSTDAGSKRKRAIVDEEDDNEENDGEKFTEEDNGSADDGSTSSESEDKGQEAEVKKTKVMSVCGSKRCDCEWEKDGDKEDGEHQKEEKDEDAKKRCDCDCEEDEPEEEHEHCHHCHGHEEGCHGCHECEHHHCDDHGHHEHDDHCHHHGHHHGFVHEWGEECCGDHDCHDCCGEHEHEHHDEGDHHHEHCCHDNHCCHHKEEEDDKRSAVANDNNPVAKDNNPVANDNNPVANDNNPVAKRGNVPSPSVKKQTVHVGYGYASGDNYRLGYQQGGMGGLASTFTGQIGAEQQGSYDTSDHYNKREPSYQPGPVREKRFYGGHAFGNLESGIAHGSATPYGHPVTHPGFTTMGFPGHALASQDVRMRISHPPVKRSVVYEDEEERLPYVTYAWSLPYELVQYQQTRNY